MIASAQALHAALLSLGLVADGPPPAEADAGGAASDRPWFIGLLLGASGWLAGLFLLVFIVLISNFASNALAGVVGLALIGAAWGLFKADRGGAFAGQFALALSVAGQCLVVVASNAPTIDRGNLARTALLLQIVLGLVMPNRTHRVLSSFFATVAWALTLRSAGDFLLRNGPRGMGSELGAEIALWACTWVPVGAVVAALVRGEARWIARGGSAAVRPVVIGLVLGLGFATPASQPLDSWLWLWNSGGYPGGFAFWPPFWPLFSALAALAAAAAAFALGQRALLAACAVAATLHLVQFYYALGTGLMTKAFVLLALGAACLVAARHLGRDARA